MSDVFTHGLPSDNMAEKLVLAQILLSGALYSQVAAALVPEEFAIEKHRRILACMGALHNRGEQIDYVTVASELRTRNQLESVDGIGYLISLNDTVPFISNLDGYIRLVKEQAQLRKLIVACQKTLNEALLGQTSAADLIAQASQSMLDIGAGFQERSVPQTVAEIVSGVDGGLNSVINPSKTRGLATGYLKFDEMTGGLHPGELVLIGARPSMGKSSLAMNIAAQAALSERRAKVAVFSLEMSKEELVKRLLCSLARVDLAKQRAGYLNQDERRRIAKAYTEYSSANLWIDYTPGASLLDVRAKAQALKRKYGLDLIVIDYLQLLAAMGERKRKSDTRAFEIGETVRYSKVMLAGDLDVPVILLSQLNRDCERRPGDKRPQMSDLRESGEIENHADVICLIYRECVYKPDREDLRGLAELLLAKQRNGPTGKINLVFINEFCRFENRVGYLGGDDGMMQ